MDRGGLNDDGGGYADGNDDGDGNTDNMARHQKRVAYEEENTIRSGDGLCAALLFPALTRIGNEEIKSLPSKQKNRIPPKKKKKFGRTKIGENKKSPFAQVNTINVLNATPLIPQRPTSDNNDPAAEVVF